MLAASLAAISAGLYGQRLTLNETVDWTLLAAGFALLVVVVADNSTPLLEWAPLCRVGILSYSMYLFHLTIFGRFSSVLNFFHIQAVSAPSPWRFAWLAFGLGLTIGLAELTRVLVENPFNRLKDRLSYRDGLQTTTSRANSPQIHAEQLGQATSPGS